MKKCHQLLARGFTLVELLVVIAIMAILLALAGGMLKDSSKGQGLQESVQTLQDLARMARQEAIAKATWTRLVVVSAPDDTSNNSPNLRTLYIVYKDTSGPARDRQVTWMQMDDMKPRSLSKGFYVSPEYSSLLSIQAGPEDIGIGKSNKFSELFDRMNMPGGRSLTGYYIEFDPQGRMAEPSSPTRLVVMSGTYDPGDVDRIRANPVGPDQLPAIIGGIVIWPKGNISMIRDREQVFGK